MLSTTDAGSATTIHLISVSGGTANDRILYSGPDIRVWDTRHGLGLITTHSSTHLATLDLQTGAIRDVGFSKPTGIGPGVVFSPDGTAAAVKIGQQGSAWEIDVIDLASGSSRRVVTFGPKEYSGLGLEPVQWLPDALLVSPGIWDCAKRGLLKLDVFSGALTRVADGEVGRLSPDGAIRAYSEQTDLADGPYEGQCGWHNRLITGPLGNEQTVVRSQERRDIYPYSVLDDGMLLYVSDDAPLATRKPTTDMGLYLYDGSVSTQQFGEDQIGQWQGGVLLAPEQALVVKLVAGGDKGTVEVDLVGLCGPTPGCRPSSSAVETDYSQYPRVSLTLVRT